MTKIRIRGASALCACLLVSFLAGCASDTSLKDVPVEDRKVGAASGGAGGSAADAGRVGRDGVQGVTLDNSNSTAERNKLLAGVEPIIYFDYDSDAIKPEFANVVDAFAKQLKSDSRRKLRIEGHTDETGGTEYNVGLGQRRADAVRAAIVAAGATRGQIETVSYGKEKPAVSGVDEAARAKNRRAIIDYSAS